MVRPKKYQLDSLEIEPGAGVENPKRGDPYESRFFVCKGRKFAIPFKHSSPEIDASAEDSQNHLKLVAAWYLDSEENFSHWHNSVERVIENKGTQSDGTEYGWAVILRHLCSRDWQCNVCSPPTGQPDIRSRVRDIRNKGFCIILDKFDCIDCGRKKNHYFLFPGWRWVRTNQRSRYDNYSQIVDKTFDVLKNYNAWDGESQAKKLLIIEHKFPEARWKEDESKTWTKDTTDVEIKAAFQLMTESQNLKKRQACDSCVATNLRPMDPFNIGFYYEGDNRFRVDLYGGKGRYGSVEKGCVGCFYYDCEEWRKRLQWQNDFVSWIESAPPIRNRTRIDYIKQLFPRYWLKRWVNVSGFLLLITGGLSVFFGHPGPLILGGLCAISFLQFRAMEF
tara:strand:- start:1179 stop:2354 length:1176 start_codon:yes stop_codon:yes gene_type:complete